MSFNDMPLRREMMAWRAAAKETDIRENEVVGVVVEGQHVALYRLDGEVFATSDVCSHQFALLSDGFVEGDCIECPLHAAQFDIKTGKVICGPALTSIATYPVRLEAGEILLDI
jgi:3-phenylpropionate/trans-cinnamate dioxygenase ferredoxin subunit